MKIKKNTKPVNEVSSELMNRAAAKQRQILKDEQYLKKITAWQYLKSLKRAEDFEKYASKIAAAINRGNIGSPDDPKIDQETMDAEHTPIMLNSVSMIERKMQIKALRKKHPEVQMERTTPVIPNIENAGEKKKGAYSVIYISSIDDDVAAVWVKADSILKAISEATRQFWDVKEIIDVVYEGKANNLNDGSVFNVGNLKSVIDLDKFKNKKDGCDRISEIMTGGEFTESNDLVDDVMVDNATEECPDGHLYEGTADDGSSWSGNKASYRDVYENGNYSSPEDHDIEIVTAINEGSSDDKISGTFNIDAFKETLRQGIVHFVFIRKGDGQERQAFGTTNKEILDDLGIEPSANKGPNNDKPDTVKYYDLVRKGWRSFKSFNLTMIYDESY